MGYEELEKIGKIPLPKYITRPVEALDSERYQTVFSEQFGAVASPTAGLHFTEDSISRIKGQGTLWVPLTLYVDWGTFQPVREDDYRRHTIHRETFAISETSAETINRAVTQKRRVLCVGTTSVRALESAYESGLVKGGNGETCLYPVTLECAGIITDNEGVPGPIGCPCLSLFGEQRHWQCPHI